MILVGLFLECFRIYAFIGKPNDIICTVRTWITYIPETLIIMAILAQVF